MVGKNYFLSLYQRTVLANLEINDAKSIYVFLFSSECIPTDNCIQYFASDGAHNSISRYKWGITHFTLVWDQHLSEA